MKQFFGAFFGSIIGLVIATVVAVLIIAGIVKTSFGAVLKDDSASQTVKANSVLKLVINGRIQERQRENPFKNFGGPLGEEDGMGLNSIIKKVNYAKTDSSIKGIYLNIKHLEAGFATTQELRDAISNFKTSGKFVYCYAENYSQQEYFLASAADKVYLNPQGDIEWKGLYMGLMFFKKTLEKLDVDMQVFRHGKFKSAVEPFMLDKMSQANRLQSEVFLGGIWNSITEAVSKDRNISVENLNRMANNIEIVFPEDAVGKLVDKLAYEDEVISEIKKKMGVKEKEKIHFAEIGKYSAKEKLDSKLGKVAVIYANGSIAGGEGDDEEIGSDRIAKAIREARNDEKIKAIVLRVNSPGGSALASDVIWREMVLARKAKPTVVSMGDLAASGGYYISCAADRIFAHPNTITGSIGVFGVIPNISKMLENKFGITIDTVNTNLHSDMANTLRPVTASEAEVIQKTVEKIYGVFTQHVAEGRKMKQADVDSIGQGRVWSGSDAMRIGLVDEFGGLNKAIEYAANKAKLKEYRVTELPKQKNPFEDLFGKKEDEMESYLLKKNLGDNYTYYKHIRQLMQLKGIQTRMPYDISIH